MKRISPEKLRDLVRDHFAALSTFVLLFSLTLIAFQEFRERTDENTQRQFTFRSRMAVTAIENRMNDYIHILKAGKGIFNATDTVTRQTWVNFFSPFNIQRNFPGLQGVGFAEFVRADELKNFEQAVRNNGHPNFMLRPAGQRDFYTPILLLEPMDWRNQRAIGYDMMSEPIRREAMMRALENNQPALSGRVILVQETNEDVQAGFLIYLPVFAYDSIPLYRSDSERLIRGFIYSPFRAGDFARDIFHDHFDDLNIEIFDGEIPDERTLLFNSDKRYDFRIKADMRISQTTYLSVAGRKWTVFLSPREEFWQQLNPNHPYYFLLGGLVISLLITLVILFLSQSSRETRLKQTITDNATAGLFLLEPDGRATFVNPAGQNITGYTLGELRRNSLPPLLTNDEAVIAELNRVIETNDNLSKKEFRLHRKNGESFYASVSKKSLSGSGAHSVVLEMLDITAEKEATLQVLEGAERFRFLANAMPDKVWTSNDKGVITYINQRWYEHINPEEAEAIQQDPNRIWDLIHPADRAELENEWKAAIQTGSLFQAEYRLKQKDEYQWHMTRGIPRKDEKGIIRMWVGAATNIDERKQHEELLQKNASQIKAINDDLNDFASVVSHDLKAPLRAIGTLADFLVIDCDYLKGQDKENLLLIKDRVKRMEGLINGILRYSRIGMETMEHEDINLNELVAEVASYIKPPAHIKIETGNLPEVHYIRTLLFQLLQNVIDNAVKYIDKPEGLIKVYSAPHEGGVVVTIEDNGPGVDPKYFQRIFKMFQTLTPRDKKESTGIGLTIVQKIIKHMGGRIWLESEMEKGTRVNILIPDTLLKHNPL